MVAVVETGYIGLHLAEAFSCAYEVIAYDVSDRRLQQIASTLLASVSCTSDPNSLTRGSHFLVSVPTIIDENQ